MLRTKLFINFEKSNWIKKSPNGICVNIDVHAHVSLRNILSKKDLLVNICIVHSFICVQDFMIKPDNKHNNKHTEYCNFLFLFFSVDISIYIIVLYNNMFNEKKKQNMMSMYGSSVIL